MNENLEQFQSKYIKQIFMKNNGDKCKFLKFNFMVITWERKSNRTTAAYVKKKRKVYI